MTQKEATPRSRKRHQYGPAALLGALLGGLVAAPLAFLPAKWACLFARGLAVPAWWLATRRRRVTLSNFRYAYGHLWSEKKIRTVALESWKRVAVSAVEALQIRKWLADPQFHDRIVWSGPWEELESRHRDGESFLLVSGHLGPFEMVLPTLVHKGWRIGLLSRRIKNGYVHAAMNALRAGTVPEILDPAGALPGNGTCASIGNMLGSSRGSKQPGRSLCPLYGKRRRYYSFDWRFDEEISCSGHISARKKGGGRSEVSIDL